jgi:hypothetical protein
MKLVVPLTLLALLTAPALGAVDVDVKPYMEAERAGAAAPVRGRIYAERRKPSGPDRPLVGAVVVALPRSDALMARLQELRSGARDSSPAYRDAADLMQKAREAYEKQLWEAGGADLVRSATVDDEGRFDLGKLPEGRWILLARWDEFISAKTAKAPRKDRDMYLNKPRLVGFKSRLVWVREVAVTSAPTADIELTDRNVWFTGVVEDRVLDAGQRR